MATKKVKKKGGGDKDWEKKLAAEADKEAAREKAKTGGGGNKISIKGRRFTFDGEVLGKTLNGVIADFAYERAYYKTKFKDDQGETPTCFALSEDGEDMKPHKNSPAIQARSCEKCPHNKWGSGKGRAKACGDRRRLAVISSDDIESPENIEEADIAMISVPPTSVTKWAKYVKDLKEQQSRSPHRVSTEMSFDKESDYVMLEFGLAEKLDKETAEAIEERREEARKMLMEPYDARGDDDEDDDEDEDEEDDSEDDDKPTRRKSGKRKAGSGKSGKRRDDDDDDDDDEDSDDEAGDDEDDEDEDEKPKGRKKGKKAGGKKRKPEADEDEDDEESEEDDDGDDEEDEKPSRKGKRGKSKRKSVEDDDEEDEDETEDEEDEEDDEEDEDVKPRKKKRKSRFSKK
jgi:hypothetical protein